jgi:hypothetical protein
MLFSTRVLRRVGGTVRFASDVAGVMNGVNMSAAKNGSAVELAQVERPAYDPDNLDPTDAEAGDYQDTSDGIDWDEIIATTQDDFEAGRYAFSSADYATYEESMAALEAWIHAIFVRVLSREASNGNDRSVGTDAASE